MCGIAGFVNLTDRPVDRDLLRRMIMPIHHRGPDGTGIYVNQNAGLAHARLSIIDIAGGSQPMRSADRGLTITYNGEIFNYIELREELIGKGHRFATRSDTEVLLRLYLEEGEKCVERLNGQWAFAIWDEVERKLFLSRDRLGIRPLFYTQTQASFVFASEIKGLLAHSDVQPELDLEALNQIFTFWVTLPTRTAFRGVNQLPPGHSLVLEDGRIRIWRHWQPRYSPEFCGQAKDEKVLADELFALLTDATRIRLRSDVPVGAYLSGGLDSTFITALAKQAVGDQLRTFSVAFQDAEFDESAFQHEASSYLETRHSSITCSREKIAEHFPDVVWHAEQPVLRTAPAALFLLSKLVRDEGFKVVLTGEGSDEMFGGYDIFKESKIRRFWGARPDSAWRPQLLKRLYPYMDALQRQSPAYLKRFFQVNPEDLKNPFFSHLPRWKLGAKLRMFLSGHVLEATSSYSPMTELARALPESFSTMDTFNQAEFLEAELLLPGYILSSQGDRVSMAHAVEGRYPFLDHRVVEFAAKLPPHLKMKVLDEKHLLKSAAAGRVPESVRKRYKQPYRAPDGPSFFSPQPDYVNDLLCEEQLRKDSIFEPKAVGQLIQKFRRGGETSVADNMALVGILSTELLIQQFLKRRNPAGNS